MGFTRSTQLLSMVNRVVLAEISLDCANLTSRNQVRRADRWWRDIMWTVGHVDRRLTATDDQNREWGRDLVDWDLRHPVGKTSGYWEHGDPTAQKGNRQKNS